MKRIILLSFLIFSIVAVNAQDKKLTRKEKKAQREAMLIKQTKELIEANTWQFNATQMLPSGGRTRTLVTPYNVILKDGEVNSYLPYFGRAYSVDYGSTDSPMIFEAPIADYSVENGKKGGYTVKFSAKNKNDNIEFIFSIGETGSVSLRVNSTNRQFISYHGDLVLIEEKEKK